MQKGFQLIQPKILPPLDPDFRPAALANHHFLKQVAESQQGVPLLIGLERSGGYLSHFSTQVFPDLHPDADANLVYVERLLKFLLWQIGGWKVYIGGPKKIADYIQKCYSENGQRSFDFEFMQKDVYEKPFTVIHCDPNDVPTKKESSKSLGRHLDGCRVGFDLGASDRKSSAVIDGEPVFSEEVIWEPKNQSDPDYHYQQIMASIRTAAEKMPRVDAIGGSAAGIYIDNRVRIASLFRGIPGDQYYKVRNLFIRIREEMGVPLEIINDGDVTALAGSMSLEENGILGIAMGSSEAGGYVDMKGNITGWLNELAFAPVDYHPQAPVDEWSRDRGVGSQYFSQQCVFRLAPKAGIDVPAGITDAEKLEFVQDLLENNHAGAKKIWQTIGCYLGYSIAHYADFYDLKHVLVLGRCTSGSGGKVIVDGAREVLKKEYPVLLEKINIQLPDERSRRVGQAIAAASLPVIS